MKKIVLLGILSLGFIAVAWADGNVKVSQKELEQVRNALVKMIPDARQAEIVASPIANVYRMEIKGNYTFVHVSGDHIMIGDLYNSKQRVNLSKQASATRMADKVKDVSVDKMIVYGPEKAERYITVFTDIDCGYCRKLHNEVPQLNAAGIQVRYLAYPRAGVDSKSYKKYVSVWCSDDQRQALTDAKSGKSIPEATCDNPISESFKLGKRVGVRGTPTIILDNGTVTPGYIPAQQLIKNLGLNN